jgi:uncharacterized membrane protein
MVESERDATTGCRRIVLRPNAALTKRQVYVLLAGFALAMGAIGVGFATLGAWLVLPFSGAEWLLLVYCFKLSLRDCSVREVITITDVSVQLERGRVKPEQTFHFQRAWIALDWVKSPINGYPSRLSFRSHGKEIEVGRFLMESEREALARELQKILFDDR